MLTADKAITLTACCRTLLGFNIGSGLIPLAATKLFTPTTPKQIKFKSLLNKILHKKIPQHSHLADAGGAVISCS